MVLCAPFGCHLAKNRIQPSGQAGIAALKVPSAHLNNQDQATLSFVVQPVGPEDRGQGIHLPAASRLEPVKAHAFA
jgi:hypothetical protein